MTRERIACLAVVSVVVTLAVARLDRDVEGFVDLVRLENVPALTFYSLLLFGMLVVVTRWCTRRSSP